MNEELHSKELNPYEQWIKDVEKMIDELKHMRFEVGTAAYYFKKNMLINYKIFKEGL